MLLCLTSPVGSGDTLEVPVQQGRKLVASGELGSQQAENWQRQLVKFLVSHNLCVYTPKFGLDYQRINFLHLSKNKKFAEIKCL